MVYQTWYDKKPNRKDWAFLFGYEKRDKYLKIYFFKLSEVLIPALLKYFI